MIFSPARANNLFNIVFLRAGEGECLPLKKPFSKEAWRGAICYNLLFQFDASFLRGKALSSWNFRVLGKITLGAKLPKREKGGEEGHLFIFFKFNYNEIGFLAGEAVTVGCFFGLNFKYWPPPPPLGEGNGKQMPCWGGGPFYLFVYVIKIGVVFFSRDQYSPFWMAFSRFLKKLNLLWFAKWGSKKYITFGIFSSERRVEDC